jgi:hypothetical protein
MRLGGHLQNLSNWLCKDHRPCRSEGYDHHKQEITAGFLRAGDVGNDPAFGVLCLGTGGALRHYWTANGVARQLAFAWLCISLAELAPAQARLGDDSFPDVKEPANLIVTLHRGDPMGGRASYRLTISGDGIVRYEGYLGVFIKGKHAGHISNAAVHQLIEELRKARFFELHNYGSSASDLPVCVTTVQIGSIRKEVVNYGLLSSDPTTPDGFGSGAPEALIQLERRIDEIVGSKRWIKGPWVRRLIHWH